MSDYYPTGETALVIVPPPDICAYADYYRGLYMPEEVERIEPHITVCVPFAPTHLLGEVEPRLRTTLSRYPPFRLSLRGFEIFEDRNVLYLKLAHPDRVLALYRAIRSEFPEYPIYGGQFGDEFVPHMTMGVFSSREELDQVYEDLSVQRLFIGWDVEEIVAKIRMSDGIWDTWEKIPLLGKET